jgi:predicted ATPase
MYLSRIRVENFRNFSEFDVQLTGNFVVVGENRVGKSNLLYALRLLFDPTAAVTRNRQSTASEKGRAVLHRAAGSGGSPRLQPLRDWTMAHHAAPDETSDCFSR